MSYYALEYRSDRYVSGRLLSRQIDKSVKDVSAEYRPWVGSKARVALRPEFERFQCKTCGRVDELACYRHGLPEDFVVPSPRVDFHVTDDNRHVWSRRLTQCVCKIAPDQLELFPLTADKEYLVPWPRRLLTPPPSLKISKPPVLEPPEAGQPFRIFGAPCPVCGRYPSTTFWYEKFVASDDEFSIGAASIDRGDRPRLWRSVSWIVSEEVATAIRVGKFTNVKLTAITGT